tara:strand:- start:15874 stop:16170 length:297 start_codon:yes stop_codon:yes gene_type:complete
MANEEFLLRVSDWEVEDMNIVCYLNNIKDDDNDVAITLYDAIPDDYNIGTRINGGYDTPNFEEHTYEDFTPRDYLDMIGEEETKKLIYECLIKRLSYD